MTRVRFAPSPTGELHIGGARTALYNYIFCLKNKGEFILRLEDTDQTRYVEGAEKRLLEDLKWLGIKWSEGPDVGGEYGPYVQSQRLDLYKKYASELILAEKAYYCFCTQERLSKLREEQEAQKIASKYDRHCMALTKDEVEKKLKDGAAYTIRLKVPTGFTEFQDLIHGEIKVDNTTIDDQVLMKSDGFPTYHLANVVDDHLMKITHVIRGEEWLPSTTKHILLYNSFGWNAPQWVHLPNILNKNKAKLSKRKDGDTVWLSTYIKNGYLPEAMVNFLAFQGWHPKDNQEMFSLESLVEVFDLKRVQKSGAIFGTQKLDWFNSEYIKKLPIDALDTLLKPFYPTDKNDTLKLSTILQSRIYKLSDATLIGNFYFVEQLNFSGSMLVPKNGTIEKTIESLQMGESVLSTLNDWSIESLKNLLFAATGTKFTKSELLWPIRVALTGEERSPDVFDVLWALGKNISIDRINNALKLLK